MPRHAEIGATRESYVYRLRLPVPLKAQWDAYCARQNKNPSDLMRSLMHYLIQDEMPDEMRRWIATQVEGKSDDGMRERLDIRFTPSEFDSVKKRAEAEGCSAQRWVINCVRASLTHEPQFTMETTKALWESSTQLRAIGRNLNQITKRLNETGELFLNAEQVKGLADYIYRHTECVSALVDASLSRWIIK